MSNTAGFIFQVAELLSALSLPVGGGLAAYSKWRRNALRERTNREEATRLAAETATREARKEEQTARNELTKEKDARINSLNQENSELKSENDRLHNYIIALLSGQKGKMPGGQNEGT